MADEEPPSTPDAPDPPDRKKAESYGLSADDEVDPTAQPVQSNVIRPGDQSAREGLPLDAEGLGDGLGDVGDEELARPAEREKWPKEALDLCPNCGSPMPGPLEILCLRCGYDMKAMKVVETKTAEAAPDDETVDDGAEGVTSSAELQRGHGMLTPPGLGGYVLPLALLGGSMFFLTVAYLFGAGPLFPSREGLFFDPLTTRYDLEAVPFGRRFITLVKFYIWTMYIGAFYTCGLAAVAQLGRRPFGPVWLAVARVMGIIGVMQLGLLAFNLDWSGVEFVLERTLQLVLLVSLTMLFFRTTWREAGTAVVLAIGFALLLYVTVQILGT